LRSLGFDARFPNQNQTKHCWQNYVDYHKCILAKGEDFAPCRQVGRAQLKRGVRADGLYSSSWLTDRCAQVPGVSDGMISVVSIFRALIGLRGMIAYGLFYRKRNFPREARSVKHFNGVRGEESGGGRGVLVCKGCVPYNKSLMRIDRSALKVH